MYRVGGIKLSVSEDKSIIPLKIKRKLGLRADIKSYRIVKESVDARDKKDIKYVYTVDFEIEGDFPGLVTAPEETYIYPKPGKKAMKTRPVIAGFGPCGMFAALILSESGYEPVVLERGKKVEERVKDVDRLRNDGVLDNESNVQFGEGGAGTFSDGKLTTGIRDIRVGKVLLELVSAGACEDILYKQKPHIGTDRLREVVKNIRAKIIKNGGDIYFGTRLNGVEVTQNRLSAVNICNKEGMRTVVTENLILAAGHSARDTARMLFNSGVVMEQKPFSIGIRIEHPQELINEAQYGKGYAAGLPPAEYKLAHRAHNGRGVYTFCMCPGGEVIVASSQEGCVVTNGMSYHARNGRFANSALLVDVLTSDFGSESSLAGIAFQEKYEMLAFKMAGEKYRAPETTWKEFALGTESAAPVTGSLPLFAVSAIKEAMPHFARKIAGFDSPEAAVYAVESRSSSPVRVLRDEGFQSSIAGIYPGGEGAGYAGGIISAAVDGIKIAEEIIKKYAGRK